MNETPIKGTSAVAARDTTADKTGADDFQLTGRSSGRFSRVSGPLKIALTIVALGVVLYSVDLQSAWKLAREQSVWLVVAAAILTLVQIGLGAVRWHLVLRRIEAPIAAADTIRIYYISVFFSACLWASVGGDLVRGWLAFRRNVNAKVAAISVILDRVAALAGVAIIVLVSAPQFIERVGHSHMVTVLLPSGLAAAGLIGIFIVAQLDRLPSGTGSFGRLQLLQQIRTLGGATRMVFLSPTWTGPVIALSIVSQICGSLAAYVIAASLGLAVSPIDCVVLMQPVTLLAALPISIGGWGVREAAVVTLFGLIGVPSSAALVMSVQIGILTIAVSLPGGILFLMQRRKATMADGAWPGLKHSEA